MLHTMWNNGRDCVLRRHLHTFVLDIALVWDAIMIRSILVIVYSLLLAFNFWITYAFVKTLPTITDLWSPATLSYSSLFMIATVVTVLIRQVKEEASGFLLLQVLWTGLLLLASW